MPCALESFADPLSCRHVDEGGNPDELLARLAVAASQANQDTQGRLLAVAALRDALLEEAARWQSDAKAT